MSEFFEDHTGKMWVGTWGGLSSVRRHKAFHNLTFPELVDPASRTVTIDRAGNLWVGTMSGVWYKNVETGQVSVFDAQDAVPAKLTSNQVSSILEDRRGRIWIGTSGGGINRYDPATGEMKEFGPQTGRPGGLKDNIIYKIFEDRAGRIWIGTARYGLMRWNEDDSTFSPFSTDVTQAETLHSNEIWTLHQGDAGRIWIGTISGGLHELILDDLIPDDAGTESTDHAGPRVKIKRHVLAGEKTPAVSASDVIAIYQQNADTLWVGTMGSGLIRLDLPAGQIERFGRDQGLPGDYVGCILPDDAGNLWLGMRSGLVRFNIASAGITTFDTSAGLASEVFFSDGCSKSSDGKLFFTHTEGVTWFDPAAITINTHPAPAVLTEVMLFNEPLKMDSSAVLKRSLSLSQEENFLSFEFAVLDFNNPDQNRLAYRLEGFDTIWHTTNMFRQINYPNLAPGHYTLHARAANNDGVWSKEAALLDVTIETKLQNRTWFRVVLLSLVGGLFFGLHAYRKLQKEKLVRVREQIADDLHDDIGSNLEALAMFLRRFSMLDTLDDDSRNNVKTYLVAVQRMTQNLRDVIWLTDEKEKGLEKLIERMRATGRYLAQDLDFQLDVQGPVQEGQLSLNVRRHLFLIYKEALHNAIKHAGTAQINVKVVYDHNRLLVEIADDGCGFDQHIERKGRGLASMARRAEQAKIDLHIRSTPVEGTMVSMRTKI